MVIGTQASGALVLATAHQAQRRAYGASAASTVPRRVVLVVLSTASGFLFTILKQGDGTFTVLAEVYP